jgi:pre-mRNA-splicing factor ISY1
MLNKWVKMREEEDPNSLLSRRARERSKRPFLASQCEHLADAERFRLQIIREIGDGIKKIQNPGMGEHAIRDLNDTINKLIREKWHWNRRIKELGGKDFNKEERKAMLLAEQQGGTAPDGGEDPQLAIGLALKGSGGYRYFGAAKELPGVKELFARHAAKLTKRKRGDIYKYITPDYYGLRDEEDGVLVELETKMAEDRQKKLKECQDEYKQIAGKDQGDTGADDASDSSEAAFIESISNGIPAQLAVPSQEVVANVLLAKKKEALLNRFA